MPNQSPIRIDASEMRRLHRVLRDLDVAEGRALTRRLRTIVKPLEAEVKTAAMSRPSQTAYTDADAKARKTFARHRLRAGLASAVQTQIGSSRDGASARIRVSGTKFMQATGKPRKLPRYYEGLSRKPWRHPVFATKGATRGTWKGAWAVQQPSPFLLPTVLPHKDEVRDKLIAEYLDTFAHHLRQGNIPVR